MSQESSVSLPSSGPAPGQEAHTRGVLKCGCCLCHSLLRPGTWLAIWVWPHRACLLSEPAHLPTPGSCCRAHVPPFPCQSLAWGLDASRTQPSGSQLWSPALCSGTRLYDAPPRSSCVSRMRCQLQDGVPSLGGQGLSLSPLLVNPSLLRAVFAWAPPE